ncbi:winged helix DNA-binding domain-containing protein [Streptomyces sp. NPDC059874]|uniref:winged helix DNA-binding domain-containing protein n=1 Tax=Streptomyces sp. NPDC059874 TaxID=3346983 RepID=UPI00364F41A5
MIISARELNRATLSRQLLLEREPLTVPDGLRRVVALQAQHPASPYVALWNRLAGFDPAGLDAAFAGRSVVKATLMRITLHAVHAGDYPDFRAAVQPTLYGARLGGRFAAAGLTPADAHALVPDLLAFARRPRTSAEMQAWAEERVGAEKKDAAWWGLKGYAALHHAPTDAPWSFGPRPSFIAAGPEAAVGTPGTPATAATAGTGAVPAARTVDPHALRALILRYLAGFGPASVADVAQFAMVQRAPVRTALRALDGAVEELRGPDGDTLYDLPGASRPPAETPAPPRLMAMWDSVLLAYADRSRVIPPAYRPLVIRRNGDVLPTLLVDGHVAGVWRPTEDGVEATAFHPLRPSVWDGLAEEARSLTAFLGGRETAVYSRYHHWWAKLPASEVRML